MTENVFARYEAKAYPFRFNGTLLISTVAGGVPADPQKAKQHIERKLADSDDLIRQAVAEIMVDEEVGADEAASLLEQRQHLNAFRRDDKGLYIGGYQLKACIKEAASIAVAADKLPMKGWGTTKKWLLGFVTEHIFVVEDRLYLGVMEPSGVAQRFPHTRHGNGIQYEEYVENAKVDFTVETDFDWTEEQWAMLWLTAGREGIGATRSQGYGRFEVVRWDKAS